MSWEDVDDDRGDESTGYGDDYSEDEDGNLVSNCTDCPYNSANQEDWQVNDMEELKRCPFCGGEAAILHYPGDGYLPHCTECDGMIEKWFDTPEEALESWNRRTTNE